MTDNRATSAAPTSAVAPAVAPGSGSRRRGGGAIAVAAALLLVAIAGVAGYAWWLHARQNQASEAALVQRVAALEERTGHLRSELNRQAQRLQQAESTNRVLRDELLGLGERAGILETDLLQLAHSEPSTAHALRLEEVELLLSQGQQRLLLAGDLDGAKRAYALAGNLLERIAQPDTLNLRQALLQEQQAIEAIEVDPRRTAADRLQAVIEHLDTLPTSIAIDGREGGAGSAWWQRAVHSLVDVQPTRSALLLEPAERQPGLLALQLELSLAQVAIERRDRQSLDAALDRSDHLLGRLWPPSPVRDSIQRDMDALRSLPLSPSLPTLGTTLEHLRQQRGTR